MLKDSDSKRGGSSSEHDRAVADQPSPAQLDGLSVLELVDKRLHDSQIRSVAASGVLVAILGLFSGLILWSVQSSGTLAGESAARKAVDESITRERSHIEKAVESVDELKIKMSQTLWQVQNIRANAEDASRKAKELEDQNRKAAKALAEAKALLDNAHALLSKDYEGIAKELRKNNPELIRAVVSAVDAHFNEANVSLKKLEPELTSLRPSANQLSGIWSYVGKSPNSCSILQTPYGLLLENEDGGYTIGILSEDHTIINALPNRRWSSVRGTIEANGRTIRWDHGAVWTKDK